MVENILQFILVVAVSFGALVVLTSFFRFQNRVATAAALDEAEAVGEEPFMYRLAGHLATGPRDPDPCLVVHVALRDREHLVDGLPAPDRAALQTFMTDHLRRRLRARDALICLEPGRHGLLVHAGADQAEGIARRLAGAFADDVFRLGSGEGVPLHVRVGVAACPEDGVDVDELLAASAGALPGAGTVATWALASPRERGGATQTDKADPLADVPASQQHLVDPVTGVLAEDHLGSTMQRFVARARNRERPASIVCLRIDQFERYRELYGNDGANALLVHVAGVLKQGVREQDLLARYGVGQFVIMLGCDPAKALQATRRIGRQAQARPLSIAGAEVMLKLTAGVAGCPDHGTVPSDVLKLALTALSCSGSDGRPPFIVYEEDMAAQHPQHVARESF